MVFVPSNLTYEALLVMVDEIVRTYPNSFVYDLKSFLNVHGKMIRFKIQNDRNLQYVLRVGYKDFEVYATVEHHPNNM